MTVNTVVGRKFTIHPKQHEDWMVVPNQWGVIIGRPSAMKIPALKQALLPLRALDARERERYSQAQAEHKAASELLDMKRNAARVKARELYSGGDENAAQAELKRHSSENPPPIQRRYIVNDATVEKLGELLNENPNGLVIERDELGAGWQRCRAKTAQLREHFIWNVSTATAHSPMTASAEEPFISSHVVYR
nr:DUF3987 domain-containing protein [Stutzerimonas kirkiae]